MHLEEIQAKRESLGGCLLYPDDYTEDEDRNEERFGSEFLELPHNEWQKCTKLNI